MENVLIDSAAGGYGGGEGGVLFNSYTIEAASTAYFTPTLPLTSPSPLVTHLPLSPSVNPGHFIFIPSFLLWLRYGHYLPGHVRL